MSAPITVLSLNSWMSSCQSLLYSFPGHSAQLWPITGIFFMNALQGNMQTSKVFKNNSMCHLCSWLSGMSGNLYGLRATAALLPQLGVGNGNTAGREAGPPQSPARQAPHSWNIMHSQTSRVHSSSTQSLAQITELILESHVFRDTFMQTTAR